ncbi:MAG TPA: 50S ribosomal protein L24 [Saprospiraceae bacterium]|nr:50S ribosomal protein L24 [Saprospiraceae bacterium]
MHIKKDDMVVVISGNSKGQKGKVLQVFPKLGKAIVEGVNMVTKHKKATQTTESGRVQEPAAIHVAKLMVIDKSGNATRIGRKIVDGKLVRYSKKSGEII